jgi:hypothetical protein
MSLDMRPSSLPFLGYSGLTTNFAKEGPYQVVAGIAGFVNIFAAPVATAISGIGSRQVLQVLPWGLV